MSTRPGRSRPPATSITRTRSRGAATRPSAAPGPTRVIRPRSTTTSTTSSRSHDGSTARTRRKTRASCRSVIGARTSMWAGAAEGSSRDAASRWPEGTFEATLVLAMGDEEAKRIILARRARFVAAALAGLNAAMCGGKSDGGDPQPCLTPSYEDAGDGGTPQPCLSPRHDEDAAADAADAAEDADAEPQPC